MGQLYEIFDVDEETPVQYVGVYTMRWRPEWGEPEAMFREVDEPQHCTHPAACIVSSDEGTSYCGWCADVARLREWVDDLQSGMYINCVYCGHRYGPNDGAPASMAEVLHEHIRQCPAHPLRACEAERDLLREEAPRLRAVLDDLLVAAHVIVEDVVTWPIMPEDANLDNLSDAVANARGVLYP